MTEEVPPPFLADLLELLSIPSVSAWSDSGADLARAANWLKGRLARAGLAARSLHISDDCPAYVYAETEQRPDRPTLLVYGHYDVQPAQEKDGWTTPPFAPNVREGRIYARGATDQKMNLLLPIFAAEAVGVDNLPCNLKFLFEGEEEILSPHLSKMLALHHDLLACDAVLSSDGWQKSPDQGDLRIGLRGYCAVEVTLCGMTQDVHSGVFGGAAPNAAAAIARLLSTLHDTQGRIDVPGFMDGFLPPAQETIRIVRRGFDVETWLARLGARAATGPADLSIPERTGLHPTIEISAISTGDFAGGLSNVIPARAQARLTCRLAPGQSPQICAEALCRALRDRTPAAFDCQCQILPGASLPYRIPLDHPLQTLAAEVLTEIDGQPAMFSSSGGSIPILGALDAALGCKTVIFGFGLPDENMHGVDEYCRMTDISRGLRSWRTILERASASELKGCM